MNYLIIGPGGTGGVVGGFLAAAGKDVAFFARGAHLAAMRENGLRLKSGLLGDVTVKPVKTAGAVDEVPKADVIFVCVKGYSLDEIIPAVKAAAEPDSVIIPVLNLFGIGDLLAGKLGEGFHVMDGCIYVTSFVSAPGEVTQQASLLKLVFGPREGQGDPPHLERILADLESAKVPTVYTKEIRRETFKKFAFISPFAAACALYDADAAQFQKEGEARETFRALASEMKALGDRLGLSPGDSFVEKSMKTVDHFQPDVTASMERDLRAGKPAEIDNLVCEVIRLCGRLGLEAPAYRRAAEMLCPKTN